MEDITMNYRERVIRTVQYQDVVALPFRHAYGLMPGVLEEWYGQGLPHSVMTEKDIYEYFGFQTRSSPLPISVGFNPPFETKVIEENDEYRIAIDSMGRTTKVMKDYATLPLAMDFPVKDKQTWLDYKRRLKFLPDRIGADLEKIVERNIATGHLNTFGTMGFYWFPRDLMGDERLCIGYYEQPELITDILETWCGLIEKALFAALERVRLDSIHFGEDMAYKNASMVSKPVFDKFIKPCYIRIHRLIERFGVPILSVDSDGCLNELCGWFADCGVNLIGPNEVQAGNDITSFRRRFGRDMAYDGGLEKKTLTQGREAIYSMLNHTIPYMKETGGGWIICLDHRIIKGTTFADFQYYVDCVRTMARY